MEPIKKCECGGTPIVRTHETDSGRAYYQVLCPECGRRTDGYVLLGMAIGAWNSGDIRDSIMIGKWETDGAKRWPEKEPRVNGARESRLSE